MLIPASFGYLMVMLVWLDTPSLAAAIRTGFAPGDRAALIGAQLAAGTDPDVAGELPMAAAGPSSAPAPDKAGGTVAVAAPLIVLALLLVVLVGGGAGAQVLPAGCGSGGTAASFGDVTLTAEQMGNAEVITRTTASRGLPARAAIVAVAASWTEAKLINDLVQHDHDSEGLFQIRVGLHGRDVAEDPFKSTNWFLDALVQVPNWQTIPLSEAASDVEQPAARYRGRYAAAQPLATAVVDLLWPAASVAAPPTGTDPGGTDPGAGEPDGTDPAAGCPSGGPDGGNPTNTIPCSAGGAGQVETAPGGVLIRVCAVGPFVVDTTLSAQVAAMVAAASAAGLNLGGGAFRSNAEQIALRRAHCGPTDYDIYQRPSSQCSPPTAIPGQSMHEWGLALDITSSGHLIASHSDPVWQWLSSNAALYGLRNLASEPWHWSTSGK